MLLLNVAQEVSGGLNMRLLTTGGTIAAFLVMALGPNFELGRLVSVVVVATAPSDHAT